MAISNKVVNRYIVKRDLKEIFPKEFTNRELIGKFFDYVMNNFFEKSYEKYVNGYIGRKTSTVEEGNFYVKEPSVERQLYQLTPMLIDKNDNNIKDIIDYTNFINTLKLQGCFINDHNRLLSNEHWSFCPPIDVDMFLNYNFYYWIEDGVKTIEIKKVLEGDSEKNTNAIRDIIGKSEYTYRYYNDDNEIVSMPFYNGMRIIFRFDDNVEYNNKIFIVEGVGTSIILVEDGVEIEVVNIYKILEGDVERNTNIINDIVGKKEYIYSYKNGEEIISKAFYNGMNVIFHNDDNSEFNNKIFIVEGVGTSIKLVEKTETEPDYFVMDRGCLDGNPWSLRNRWFHIDTIKQANKYNNIDVDREEYIQAKRPIICFNRDIELYNFGDFDRGYVDVITSQSKNDIQGQIVDEYLLLEDKELKDGSKILFVDNTDSDFNNMIFELYLVDTSDNKKIVTLFPVVNGKNVDGKAENGECIKVKNTMPMCYHFNGEKWVVSQQKEKLCQSPLFNLYDKEKNELNNQYIYPNSSFRGNTIFNYKNVDNENISIDKVLKRKVETDGIGNYIYDNTIFSEEYTYKDVKSNVININKTINGMRFYKINNEDTYLNEWHLSDDILTQYVMTEITITDDREYYTYYDDKELPVEYEVYDLEYAPYENDYKESVFVYLNGTLLERGYEFGQGTYYIETTDEGTKLYIAKKVNLQNYDTILVRMLIKDVEKLDENYVYDIPLMLSSNAFNENITEIKYNEMFSQLESILENQKGFSGLVNGINNYKDTKKDLSLGTKIVQHSTPIVKTMLLNSKENTNVRNVLNYISDEYTKFKNKFKTILNNMVNSGEYREYDKDWNEIDTIDIIKTILYKMNIGKEGLLPFYNNGVAEDLIDLSSENILEQLYIPTTPAYLGIDNCYKPEVIKIENSTKNYLLCHDGSLEQLNDDYSDKALIDFENEIYNSILSDFKDNLPVLIKQKYIPGKFRKTEYSYEDYLKLYTPIFEKWAIDNNLDYTNHDSYNDYDSFTWNWSTCSDKDGFQLPGSYHGIYMYYYDTDRPHTHPWEMLGLGSKPSWWEEHYGTAPYTSENIPMWKDIEEGHIIDGDSKGYYDCFKRPGLIENHLLPVDEEGNLKDPYAIGIASFKPITKYANQPWKIGDMGDIENLWRYTSDYRYSLQLLLYLMKPLEWVEKTWNSLTIESLFDNIDYEQIINSETGLRDVQTDIILHNELVDGEYVRHMGSQQWFSDYLVSKNIDITNYIGNDIRNMSINLGYRCAGYFNDETIRVISDNYGVIPNNNYHLKLGEKIIGEDFVYSAMIITKLGNAWMIDGLDFEKPYFEVLTPIKNSKKTSIEVNGRNFVYYNNYSDNILKVNYKTIFTSAQELYNVICGYEKYLESKGFVFNLIDSNGEQIDFRSEGKKFLLWCDNPSTELGMKLTLNPLSTEINLKQPGFINIIGRMQNGFWTVTDAYGNPIYNEDIDIYRHNGYITIKPKKYTFGLARFLLSEKENIIIFDNKTIYNDTLYNSLKGIKTERFKLLGVKTSIWDKTYYTPGYIFDNETIVPNFDKLANDINYVYDSDDIRSFSSMGDEAKKTIGYHKTNYMQNLLIDDRNMFDFYKGMLKEKGTRLSINKLNRSTHIQSEGSSNIGLDEHWAFNVGRFGFDKNKATIELLIKADEINNDPQTITFSTNPDYKHTDVSNIDIKWNDENWLKRNLDQDRNTFIYKDYGKKMPVGGFAQIDDCNYIVENKEYLDENIDNLNIDDKVWVVSDENYSWNIYKKVDDEENPLKAMKVLSIKDLLLYNTINLNKGDLIYVEKDILNKWVSTIKDEDSNNIVNLYINDINNLLSNQNIVKDRIGWSVYSYTGIVPYSYVVSMPNGIVSVINNYIDYSLRIKKGLIMNMPDGKDVNKNNLYTNHKVLNDIEVSSYMSDETISDGNFTNKFGKFIGVKFTCIPNYTQTEYVYIASVRFENGILPMVINSETNEISINYNYFEENNEFISNVNGESYIDTINSACYINKGKELINCFGDDWADAMTWTRDNKFCSNIPYNKAKENRWNGNKKFNDGFMINNHPTIYTEKYGYSILKDGNELIIYDTSNGNNLCDYKISDISNTVQDYKYLFIDDKDNAYKTNNFDNESIEEPFDPQENDFWYNSETNLLSRYNGYFWENGHKKLYAWTNGDNIIYTLANSFDDETPTEYKVIYEIYNNEIIRNNELKFSKYNTKKFAWIYNDKKYYSDKEEPIPGDLLYSDNLETVADYITSYFTDTDYLYCDTKKYIRSIEDDVEEILTVTKQLDTSVYYQYERIEENDWSFDYYSKVADVSINNGKLVNISVPNPYVLERIEPKQINIDIIDSIYLVDNKTNLTMARLEKFDPLHNVFPEKLINEIDYITSYDPVNYDNSNNWYDEKLGRLWWDTSKVRYLDYYQGDLKYRRDNWGKQLPGSEIIINEWTKSSILPEDAEKYVIKTEFNSETNKNDIYYYFWVSNPISVPEQDFRKTSAFELSKKINSPQDEGILWFSPISLDENVYNDSTFIIGNFDDITQFSDFVVQINLKNEKEVNSHNEWLMVVENSSDNIPDMLWNKMKDSLITKVVVDGEDLILPDPKLTEQERYGIQIRPRQIMFKDVLKARRNFVDVVNDILSSRDTRYSSNDNYDLLRVKDESYEDKNPYKFLSHEEMINTPDKSLIGNYVLVESDEYYDNIWTLWIMNGINDYTLVDYQKYDMNRYLYNIDAYLNSNYSEDNYDYRFNITISEKDLTLKLKDAKDKAVIRFDDPNTRKWLLLKELNKEEGTMYVVGIKDGYLQISDKLYTYMEDNNQEEFIDGLSKYEYLNNEVQKCIEIICDYFYNN